MAVVLLSPFLGVLADLRACKKRALLACYLLCVAFTLCLSRFGPGDIAAAMICFIFANVAFSLGENFNSSFLPELAKPHEIGRISGYGWGMGYVGGLANLGLCFPLLQGGFTLANQANLQHTSVLTALFFLFTGWPVFLILRERAVPKPVAPGELWRAGAGRIAQTVRLLGSDRRLRTFFSAFFLYSCGVATIIAFAAIYAEKEIGFGGQQLILFFLLLQISASAGAFLFGILQDRWGSIPTLRLTLVIWIVVVAGAALTHTVTMFYVVGNLAGLAIGSVQSASRAVVALLAPEDRHAEYFGFWGLFGKLAAGFGPLVYGLISYLTHSSRLALMGPLAFFLLGGWLVGKVKLDPRQAP